MASTTNLTGVVSTVRLLRIDGFSLTDTMDRYDCIKSRWNVDGYDWETHLYPAGMWVELKLMFLSQARSPNVRARLGCLLVHPHRPAPQEKFVSHVFNNPDDYSSAVLLLKRHELLTPASLEEDYLTVQCTITVLKKLPDPAATPIAVSSNLHRHFRQLLQSQTGVDVTFLVSGESFAAHKAVLAARSPVLMAEFFGHMREKSSRRVEVNDMEAAAFKAMLHFIYTDKVPELDGKLDAATMMAQHLLAAADRYGLDRLKQMCESKLFGGISEETAAMTLALAEQHNCSQLKDKCVDFILSTSAVFDAVLKTDGYKHLEASCPSVVTDLLKSARGRGRKS